ncbi:MAG TPA: hypothetical protein VLM20_08790 [Methylophilaceae bacterium]|nr:hypothetical protein [Methylophilaceae bacterium]
MTIEKKTASSTDKATSTRTTVTKRATKTASATTRAKTNQSTLGETKVTQTQIRKAGIPSIGNNATQKQLSPTTTIKLDKKKMERDSFTMPKEEYAQFSALKKRLEVLGQPAKKSELLRAGIKLLTNMTDVQLKEAMLSVPVIKTGRPKKKK